MRKILIVEQDMAAARTLETTLAGFGYQSVGVAAAVADAAAAIDALAPDIVLVPAPLASHGDPSAAADEIRQGRDIAVALIDRPFTERELRLTVELALSRQSATRQVHELEDRFFAVSIDMLCFLDFNGYFKRLNPAWERTLGYSRQELMSRPFIEFVHPDDRERTLAQNGKVRGGGKAIGFENRYRCRDGSYRWLLWNAAPDYDERVIYSVARDVTDRKQAEAERELLVQELQAALAEVRQLQDILPMCSYCKKIRDDENYWQTVEAYFTVHTNTQISHGICPSCYVNIVIPELEEFERG